MQREIKGRDPSNGTEWKTLHNAPASGSEFLPVEGKILAINTRGFFRRNVEDKNGAVDFDARQLDRLAGFLHDGAGEFVTALSNGFGNATQHALALKGGQAASGSEGLYGGGDGSFGMLAPRLDYSPHYAAIEGGADLDDVAIFHPAAVDEDTVGCDRGERHFRHFSLLYANSVFDYRPWLAVAFF